MPRINEKDILKNIKQSVENETPDVWEKIRDADECKHDFEGRPIYSSKRRGYMPAVAAVAFAMILFAGFNSEILNLGGKSGDSYDLGGGQTIQGPRVPTGIENASDSISKAGAPNIAVQITKEADLKEASRALKFDITEPSWVPEGFKKISSKLYSFNKDFSQPYMYNMEYMNGAKKILTLNVTKHMTEEEKLKSQPEPMPMPMPAEGGVKNNTGRGNTSSPDGTVDLPATSPDKPNSIPGYNPSSPTPPQAPADKPSATVEAKPTPRDGGGSTSSSGSTSSANPGKPVSVDSTTVKVKGVDVSLTVVSSSEFGSVSAFFVYNGGNYNIFTDSVSKNDMIKIIESMVK
jgi:hypothetical protein